LATSGSGGPTAPGKPGGIYGGGGGGADDTTQAGGAGGQGGCRIIWGIGRNYPLNATGSLNHG
jgi:hypothetical protein